MTLPGALIVLATVLLVAGPVIGLVFFSPARAAAVKLAEIQPEAVVEQIGQLRFRHPEIAKRGRLDRHDTHIWLQIGLWLYGWGVILAAAPNSNLAALSWGTQEALGICLLIGSSLAMSGVVLGLPLPGGRRIARRVSHNMLSELLGDDVRLPYTLGWAGLLSISVSMSFYAITVYRATESKLLGVLGAGLSGAIGAMCLTLGIRFIVHIRGYIKSRDELIAEAVARIDRDGQ